ncbi:serine/threonine-protein kinase 31 [Leptodactylus fuscus]|uniref:serine/threonine-protein kinase 31 n=1 Tax=Leptodactylus fuscus TaxID=238119 RepID=UPI003F4F1DB9
MEVDASPNKVEQVYVSHIEDAVTFWGQSLSRIHDISKISESLAKCCPTMSTVFGTPDLDKVYGGMFSADKCWYRCKLLHVVNDEQCTVTYIDYGNTEVLDRASIVELPEELQSPPIAKKYRLWGLQLQPSSDIEQGLKFLSQLVADKQVSVFRRAVYHDGTAIVQVSHDNLDIGEEVAKKGFALKCRVILSPNGTMETMDVSPHEIKPNFPWQSRSVEKLREPKTSPMFNRSISDSNKESFVKISFEASRSPADTNGGRGDQRSLAENKLLKDENKQLKDESLQLKDEITLLKKANKLLENENSQHMDECRKLKEEKESLDQKSITLELQMQKMELENKNERELCEKNINEMEMRLASAAGNKLKALAAKIDILKTVRCNNSNVTAADDLLEAVKIVGHGQLSAPSSLNVLEENWKEYSFAQEMIRDCLDVVELDLLIDRRNRIKEKLNSSVDTFVIEVDQMPLETRLAKLQTILTSLEDVYGASCECEDSDAAFQKFYNWKDAKLETFSIVRNDTDGSLDLLCTWLSDIEKFFNLKSNDSCGSSDIELDIDKILEKVDYSVSKELEISLVEPDENDRKIIRNAYNRVVKLIFEETCLISALQSKYVASVEFKKNMSEWINKNPNVDNLLTVKKSIKSLKAELRWKLHVSSTMEESDEYNATAHSEVKQEMATIRNKIFSEIEREQDEYAILSNLVQNWFPELPLLYSDVGITSYMNSGGLLSGSIERMLFDAEPLKELSSKRPLVCTEVQSQKILLKGYSVGMDTEEQVIVRASKYHKAWLQQKEESGIMKLLYLFFCKLDPVVYLMVPFYPGESLGCIQATNKLSSYETVRVMRGVAHGLHTLHASNIIIGSLHENNVFAVNRERGIVGDFDFTRDAEQRHSATSICFPMLTAPEVKLGQPASASSDVYAYGILLLWLCTGNKNIVHKSDGTPDLKKLDLESKAEALLSCLVCNGDRMQAEQIKAHEYFKITDAA